MSISAEVSEQYGRAFTFWSEVIASCPDAEWRRGDLLHLTPARAALHAIETVEFYAGDGPDGFAWGHTFGINWEQVDAAGLPSQADVGAYAADVARWLGERLAGLSDAQLLSPTTFPWTGSTRLATLLYCLRHTQHHLAQVAGEVQRRCGGQVRWH